jgi:hypothetical protein
MLWGSLPHAVVENMAYTEGLFTALAVWTLLAVLRSNWLTAGTLCLFAGLTRPAAAALIAAVFLAALVTIIQRRDGWRPWLAMLLAPLGYVGYVAWVGLRLGRLDGYLEMQRSGWNMRLDAGGYTLQQAGHTVTEPSRLGFYVITLSLAAAIVLFVLAVRDRQPWPLLVYAGVGILLVVVTAGGMSGKARYLLPLFPLLLPVAARLVPARPGPRAVVLLGLALFSAWYGAYLTLDWPVSP